MARTWFAPLLLACTLALPGLASGQAGGTGRIVGRVLDAESGRALTGARILVQGTTRGATAGVDGRYLIQAVPGGTQTLTVSLVGYADKTITGLQVPGGGSVSADVTLSAQALGLEAITVTASAERGSVSRALDEQRTAVGVVSSVTAEQIARSPDGDAAAAVGRVAGVTVQEGRNVFVRGLGERYTTTTLNGARLPSPEPERRSVPLDLFPAGLLQSITTVKTFTPDLPGDFAGAQVNIETREFPTRRTLTVSTSGGFNDAATGQSVFAARTRGGEWLAFGSSGRRAPAQVASPGAISQLASQSETNHVLRELRSELRPLTSTGLPNSSFGISLGGQDPVVGQDIGYLASGTYSFSQEVRANEFRANPIQRGGQPEVLESWTGSTGRTSVLLGGMLNMSTLFGESSRISFNNTLTRTADNEAREDVGLTDFYQVPARRSTVRYVERTVRSNQLRGEHSFGDRSGLDWNLTSSGVRRAEPDRSDLVYVQFQDGAEPFFGFPASDPEALRRTFADLREDNWSVGANGRLLVGDVGRPTTFRFGGTFRATDRDATSHQFSIIPRSLPADARALQPEEIVERYSQPGSSVFRIANASQAGRYDATEQLGAGFAMVERPLGERLRLIGGARVEAARIRVDTELASGGRAQALLEDVDILPSLVLNYAIRDNQSLRLSASQTLARPEYRELSPFSFLEVIGGTITRGNANLRRSLIRNLDARWELYPTSVEVLSVAVFAKQFDSPIERVDVATGGPPLITFINSDAAFNLGVELEVRRELGDMAEWLSPFSVFSNVTLMHSRIDINERASANTNPSRPMIGQAPYVVNLGANYTHGSGATTATLLYNVVGPRIWAAGAIPFPDIYEQPRHLLDLSLRFPVRGGLSGRIDGRNLLDAPYILRQGPIDRERYRSGRVFTLGFTWRQGS